MLHSSRKAFEFVRGLLRNAPWVMIAIVIHVIAIAVVSVVYITHELAQRVDHTTVFTSVPRRAPPPDVPEPEITRTLVPKPPSGSELVPIEFATQQDLPPEPDDNLRNEIGEPGTLDDAPPGPTGGTSIGINGPGHHGTGVPSSYVRGVLGGGGGGGEGPKRNPHSNVGTEKAVLEGLRWLARHQNSDGSWGLDTLREHCDPKHPCIPADVEVTANYNEGLTGLALLAFLGAGITHDSTDYITDPATGSKHVLGDVVKRGLVWLKRRQHEDGSFSEAGHMYNEALATMAMTEAYGLSRNNFFREPAERGVRFLIAAQKASPADDDVRWGWRYESKERLDARHASGEVDDADYFVLKSDCDISATGWVVMALKSAAISGFEVPPEVLAGALHYARTLATDDGLSGYQARAQAGKKVEGPGDHFQYHTGTMTALNMLVRTFVAHDLSDPFLELGAQRLVADLPTISKDKLSIDYYYWYYASLALEQFDGPDSPRNAGAAKQKYWGPWKHGMESALLDLQNKSQERDACARGGWLVNDRWSAHGHALYNTAINTLTLEVYYRYANAFGARVLEQAEIKPK